MSSLLSSVARFRLLIAPGNRFRRGVELPANSQKNPANLTLGGAENGALVPDLAELIDTWPTLPETVRIGVLALVRATCQERVPTVPTRRQVDKTT